MNRERRNTKWALIICAIGLAILLVGLWGWRQATKAHYERVKAELVAKGAKLTIEEQLPVVAPTLSNGGELFLTHAAGIARPPEWWQHTCMELVAPGKAMIVSKEEVLPFELENGRWTNDLWKALPAIVEPSRGAWTLLKDAVTNEVIALDLPYGRHLNFDYSHLGSYRNLHMWLRLAVLLDLRRDTGLDAVDEVVAGVELIAKYREPTLISQMSRCVTLLVHVQTVWEAIHGRPWKEDELARLQGAIRGLRFAEDWEKAVAMERAWVLRCFEEAMAEGRGELIPATSKMTAVEKLVVSLQDGLLHGGPSDIGEAGREFGWWFAPGFADAAIYAGEAERWIGCVREAIRQRNYSVAMFVPRSVPNWYQLSVGFKAMRWAEQRMVASETIRSVALAAVALERFRLLSHVYPRSLDALVPDLLTEVPVDWFDGKPLRYRREADGSYWLWSIGSDGVDDGCKPADAGEDWLKGADLVWPQPGNAVEVESYLARQRAKMLKASGR